MTSQLPASMVGFERNLVVGIGGLAVSNNQAVILTTYSLGSCLGVTIYDPVTRAGGMLHAMLPDSSINSDKAAGRPAIFVDTGIGALFRATYALRAEKYRMQICVAGGAQFLDTSGVFNIGQRNYHSLTQLLGQHKLRINAEDVGGLISRTIHLHMGTGEVRLKRSGQNGEEILLKGYASAG